MSTFAKTIFISLVLFVFQLQSVIAQCAMCRAGIESNVSDGDTSVGAGLNMGILYLFVAPYLLMMVIGFFWYRSAKRKKRLSL
ncbi:hypothetical protein [Lunatibacter salilacus]|uniref:hypothetical protein n=1 Tax=Lunatibacter salilacus TaxID=2483804 RepID=UPI00131C8119|nr:hypothetical protein [Lunatibacter salilacus]